MPCGPVAPATKSRRDETILDPFSFSQASSVMQGWTNIAFMMSAPLRAAMVLADEALRAPASDRD